MPLLENPQRYSKLLTSLKAHDKISTNQEGIQGIIDDVKYERTLSPFTCSMYIEELISDLEDENLALQSLPIKKDMFENFRRLQKISPKFQHSIVWKTTSELGVSLSAATNIAKLENLDDQEYLFQATLDHKFSKDETDHIVRLKKTKPDLSISQCVEQVKKFRPVVIPIYYVILDITDENLHKLKELQQHTDKKIDEILKEIIENKINCKARSLVIKGNRLALNLDDEGYKNFEQFIQKWKVDVYDLISFFFRDYRK